MRGSDVEARCRSTPDRCPRTASRSRARPRAVSSSGSYPSGISAPPARGPGRSVRCRRRVSEVRPACFGQARRSCTTPGGRARAAPRLSAAGRGRGGERRVRTRLRRRGAGEQVRGQEQSVGLARVGGCVFGDPAGVLLFRVGRSGWCGAPRWSRGRSGYPAVPGRARRRRTVR